MKVTHMERACLMRSFFSDDSFCGNWILNWMIRSPRAAGLLDKGIPSPVTSLLYCGLHGTGIILALGSSELSFLLQDT